MKVANFWIPVAISMFELTSCMLILEAGNTRKHLEAEIEFLGIDGSPIADAQVVVTEGLPLNPTTTDVLKTDSRGRVFLNGDFCLPMTVGTKGGRAAVVPEAIKSHYKVIVQLERGPPLVHSDFQIQSKPKSCG